MTSFIAQRPQSARPHVSTQAHRPATMKPSSKITLATFKFAPNSNNLERSNEPIQVQCNVTTLLQIIADDFNSGLHKPVRMMQASRFRTHLPNTILIGSSCEPMAWYFTSKDGYVVRKHRSNCTWKSVLQTFCGHLNKGFSPLSSRAKRVCRDNWPVAIGKFIDGRTRLLTASSFVDLIKALESAIPNATDFAQYPFCLTQFIPPAKRLRYISVYTVNQGKGECQVVVAELPPFYREQVHGDSPATDGNINTDPIEIVEHERSFTLGEAIEKETTLLAHHINRHQSSTATPVVNQLILEYIVHAKENLIYMTSILGISWQSGEQVQLAQVTIPPVEAPNNDFSLEIAPPQLPLQGPIPITTAIAHQSYTFSRSLKGSHAMCEAAERQVVYFEQEAEKYKAQVVILQEELHRVSTQLQLTSEGTHYKVHIQALERSLEEVNHQKYQLEAQLVKTINENTMRTTDLSHERTTFCVALQQAQDKIESLTSELKAVKSSGKQTNTDLQCEVTAHARTKQFMEGLEALISRQKESNQSHLSQIEILQAQLQVVTQERDHLQRLVPYANVKKTQYCKRLHLNDLYNIWPDWQLQVECLDRIISMHVLLFQRTFDHFQPMKLPMVIESLSITRTYPLIHHRLNFAQVVECMRCCNILTTRFTTATLEIIYLKCTETSHNKQLKRVTTAGVGRPRGMSFLEFLECIIRTSITKTRGKYTMGAEAVQYMVEKYLTPASHSW
ncbi:hypothetical protein THRCLA_07833 [Thraustotheca clavata]|uniref:Uncharacterized protein n=1 Tax=Thraustotheca clavata TaxID=74557 RepID=A0A1V9ZC30_9STRA|nr:hypothetical protein THRCLA_07833 [Thraustotheca clavata]